MTKEQALSRLTSLCSKAEYCTYDLQEKMHHWGVDEATQKKLLAYLVEEQYVDDERYCHLYVKDKLQFNRWGRRKIYESLARKRINKTLINDALDEIDNDEYVVVLKDLLRQKARSIKANSDYELNTKLIKFAQGRGFTYDIIRRCLDTDPDIVDEE